MGRGSEGNQHREQGDSKVHRMQGRSKVHRKIMAFMPAGLHGAWNVPDHAWKCCEVKS